MNATVSIIIPVYNGEKEIAGTLKSVLKQSYPIHEIIMIDDGSTDNSKNIIQSFANIDKRIKLISESENRGPYTARQIGAQNATGDYIYFVDCGDRIKKNTISKLIECCRRNDADIAVMGACYSLFGGMLTFPFSIPERVMKQPVYDTQAVKDELMPMLTGKRGLTCSMVDKLYSRNLFMHPIISYTRHVGEDLIHNFQLFANAGRVAWTPYQGYLWTYSGGNTKYYTRMWQELKHTYPTLHSLIDKTDTTAQWKERMHLAVCSSRLADLREAIIQNIYFLKTPEDRTSCFAQKELEDIIADNLQYNYDLEIPSAELLMKNSHQYFHIHRKFYNFMRLMHILSFK